MVGKGNTMKAIAPKSIWNEVKQQKFLHMMVLPGMVWLIVFAYLPMAGLVMAFQEFNPFKGFFGSPFVGVGQFSELLSDNVFWSAFRNTVGMSSIKVVLSFITPIVFALMINEVTKEWIKKPIQTISYLPHFISWVVVAGIFSVLMDTGGLLDEILMSTGIAKEPLGILMDPGKFWVSMALMDIWKEIGWWSTIYIAAISGIPPELYEAAVVDGAGRIRRILDITLPCIRNTIIILLILNVGSLLSGGLSGSNFNQSYLLGNALNKDSSEILDTYTLRMGLQLGRLSFATASGLIHGILSLLLFSMANWISRRVSGNSLY